MNIKYNSVLIAFVTIFIAASHYTFRIASYQNAPEPIHLSPTVARHKTEYV